jgi:hypothetical protein
MSCLATGMRNKRCASPHFSTGAQLAQLARSRCRCASAPVRQSPLGDGATGAARHPFLHGLLQLDLSDWRIYLTARGGIRAKRRMKDVYPGARGQVPSRAVAYSLGRIESGTLPGTRSLPGRRCTARGARPSSGLGEMACGLRRRREVHVDGRPSRQGVDWANADVVALY